MTHIDDWSEVTPTGLFRSAVRLELPDHGAIVRTTNRDARADVSARSATGVAQGLLDRRQQLAPTAEMRAGDVL
ncbi:MAG TPA: hypothetical protein VIW24_21950 [Aldersonia sp.]